MNEYLAGQTRLKLCLIMYRTNLIQRNVQVLIFDLAKYNEHCCMEKTPRFIYKNCTGAPLCFLLCAEDR
jgi:hypothetical protein